MMYGTNGNYIPLSKALRLGRKIAEYDGKDLDSLVEFLDEQSGLILF